ncbi:MAG: hypothetical protein ACO29U_10685, partial [Crocinitomicaceae bacterium]
SLVRNLNEQKSAKKDIKCVYFILAFSNILFAVNICFEKSTDPFLLAADVALRTNASATLPVNVGILLIAMAIT